MKKKTLLASVLALLLVLTTVFGMMPTDVEAASSSEIKKQINEMNAQKKKLQEELKELKAQYKANENEMVELVNQKNLIDQEIRIIDAQIRNSNDQIAAFNLLIADKQDELDNAQERFDELSRQNKERIRAMEEKGSISYWAVIFQANSFSDLLDRLTMVNEIAEADQRRLDELGKAIFSASVGNKTAKDLFYTDFKEFHIAGHDLAVSQITCMDSDRLLARKTEFLAEMERIRLKRGLDSVVLMLRQRMGEQLVGKQEGA